MPPVIDYSVQEPRICDEMLLFSIDLEYNKIPFPYLVYSNIHN